MSFLPISILPDIIPPLNGKYDPAPATTPVNPLPSPTNIPVNDEFIDVIELALSPLVKLV
jgi:hypothetical protein